MCGLAAPALKAFVRCSFYTRRASRSANLGRANARALRSCADTGKLFILALNI
jgi:hypothetical protein